MQGKPSVSQNAPRCSYADFLTIYLDRSGRVAAGAIAEKYLKDALGVEFVAFVSSVGKVHIPSTKQSASQLNGTADDDENDESDELLSEEYLNLMNTITREQVDASQVRCPDAATTERMVKVGRSALLFTYF